MTAPPPSTPTGTSWPVPPLGAPHPGLATWGGTFDTRAARRLLLRAGFGPAPGEAERLAAGGLAAAVADLVRPSGAAELVGPAPATFAPATTWGHGHCAWLDRMVRTTQPLQERMALVWHDWWAVSQAGAPLPNMPAYEATLRRRWRGPVRALAHDLTIDPAMLDWLDGARSTKNAPNENYAREVMELFLLGADRGAYTEQDVRTLAKALTGWRADWSQARGLYDVRFEPRWWDATTKTLFAGTAHAVTGPLDARSGIDAVVDHPLHASHAVLRLWSAFVPTAPHQRTLDELVALYRADGTELTRVLEAILRHPDLHAGPAMVMPPVVWIASMLRARGMAVGDAGWAWRSSEAGQMLWAPPNVSGWNERGWLSTATMAFRWQQSNDVVWRDRASLDDEPREPESPEAAYQRALDWWGRPTLAPAHETELRALAGSVTAGAGEAGYWGDWRQIRRVRQLVLRTLMAGAPDAQVA